MKFLSRFLYWLFSPEKLIKPEKRLGDLPSSKELYGGFLKLAWPTMLESAVTAMTSFVDTMMVGTLSTAAISAVGLTGQPRLLIFAFFFSINAGITAVVSRKKGQGDRDGANAAMHTGLLLCLAMAVIAFTLASVFSVPLLKFAGGTGENAAILPEARVYFLITVAGVCINAFGMAINAAQRACSNTKIAFRTTVIANAVNVVFNYLLINGHFGFPRLEVRGAAIATLLGNICACAVSVLSVLKKDGYLRLSFARLKHISVRYMGMIGRVSMGTGLEQLFLRTGMFMFAKVVAELGTDEFATHQICMTLISITFAFGDGLGVAASALVGQNLGKNRSDLSEISAKAAQRVGMVISVVLFTVFMFGGRWLVSLFSDVPFVVDTGERIMRIIAVVALFQVVQTINTGCLRGAGDTHYTAFVSFFSIAITRPIIAYVLCYPVGLGVIGAWIALFIDQTTRSFASSIRFAGGKWKTIKLG
ncbi:MAG: MATE family efflux transporter [Clostridia bacterium]|nr:MATE family efflux transporter [Clostridia bacterium]